MSTLTITLFLALLWFVLYWLVAGVLFAIIGLVRFMRINTARFSCLFTILSLAAAYAAAWTTVHAATRTDLRCFNQIGSLPRIIPGVFRCDPQAALSHGAFWFVLLLAAGIGLMFLSRIPDRAAPTPKP